MQSFNNIFPSAETGEVNAIVLLGLVFLIVFIFIALVFGGIMWINEYEDRKAKEELQAYEERLNKCFPKVIKADGKMCKHTEKQM